MLKGKLPADASSVIEEFSPPKRSGPVPVPNVGDVRAATRARAPDRYPRPTCLAEGTYSGVPGRTNQDVPAHGSPGTSEGMSQWSRLRVNPLSVGREALTRTTQIPLRAGLGGGQSLSRRPSGRACLVWRRRVNDRYHFDRRCLGVYLHRRPGVVYVSGRQGPAPPAGTVRVDQDQWQTVGGADQEYSVCKEMTEADFWMVSSSPASPRFGS